MASVVTGDDGAGLGTITPPPGWVQIGSTQTGNPGAGNGTILSTWLYIVPTNYRPIPPIPTTWTFSNKMYYDVRIAVYTGVDPLNPVDAAAGMSSGAVVVGHMVTPVLRPRLTSDTLIQIFGWWQPPYGIVVTPAGLTQEWYDSPNSFMGNWMGDLKNATIPTLAYTGVFG